MKMFFVIYAEASDEYVLDALKKPDLRLTPK